MKRYEHLLTILGEEAVEVAQRCSKALRFGLHEVEPGQGYSNRERILVEFADFFAVLEMLNTEGVLDLEEYPVAEAIEAKKAKVEKFLTYSRHCGTLED